jgi:uncharacterized protein YbjT (DUF2867 family)
MSASRVLVTAALGTTGSRIVDRLNAVGQDVVEASRRANGFDWYQPESQLRALDGVDRVYLVAPAGDPDPATVMTPFLEAARAAGVRRAVLLSSSPAVPGSPGIAQVHAALPSVFEEWAVLRPTWFMQNFLGAHPHAQSLRRHRTLLTATGGQAIALIDADDIADVAVHALLDETAPNTDWLLTGPEALTYTRAAEILSDVTGVHVPHKGLTEDELQDFLASFLPAGAVPRMAALDRIIAGGSQALVTDVVREVTGRPPHTFRDWVVRHREEFLIALQ